MQQKGNTHSDSKEKKGHIEKEINRLGPRPLQIFEMLIQSREGLTAEEVWKEIKISKATISSYLSKLRGLGLARSVDEQKENGKWTVRYFIEEIAVSTIDAMFLTLVIDHPGICTEHILDKVPFSREFTRERLNALKDKRYLSVKILDQCSPPQEKWQSLEDA